MPPKRKLVKDDEENQSTAKGLEIPVPKRSAFERFIKGVKKSPKKDLSEQNEPKPED